MSDQSGTAKHTEQDIAVNDKVVEEKGASLVEYALLVALIAIVAIVSIRGFGSRVSGQFSSVVGQM